MQISSLLCGSFHVSSGQDLVCISCQILSRQMASLPHVVPFLYVSLSQHLLFISYHFFPVFVQLRLKWALKMVKYLATFWTGKQLLSPVDHFMYLHFCTNVKLSNVLLHLKQEYDFSPVLILSCIFISPLILNVVIKCHISTMQFSSLLCGSFDVSSSLYLVRVSCHILSRQMTFLLCGSFHA